MIIRSLDLNPDPDPKKMTGSATLLYWSILVSGYIKKLTPLLELDGNSEEGKEAEEDPPPPPPPPNRPPMMDPNGSPPF